MRSWSAGRDGLRGTRDALPAADGRCAGAVCADVECAGFGPSRVVALRPCPEFHRDLLDNPRESTRGISSGAFIIR